VANFGARCGVNSLGRARALLNRLVINTTRLGAAKAGGSEFIVALF